MKLSAYTHLFAVCAYLWIAGTSGFSLIPATKYIGGSELYSSTEDGGQSAYEQQMKGMMQQDPSLVAPQPNVPNEAQLMEVQERQFLDRPMMPATPATSATTTSGLTQSNPPASRMAKSSDYVDFEPDPQYFWQRDIKDYERSETRWVRKK